MINKSIVLAPGLLFTLSTRVEPAPIYSRDDLEVDPDAVPEGQDVTRWTTTRTVQDKEAYEEATKLRAKLRKLITGALIPTPFGFLICPAENEPTLDAKIAEAKALASLHNDGSFYKVKITPMRGEIAHTKGEAVSAVQQEVTGLLVEMEKAIAAGEVGSIRDIAGKATQMGKLLDQQSAARASLDGAVKAARTIARKVKRAAAAGEEIAAILETANRSPIAQARFLFQEAAGEGEGGERPTVEVEEPEGPGLPGVAVGRFAGIEVEEENDEVEDPEVTAASAKQAEILGPAITDALFPESYPEEDV